MLCFDFVQLSGKNYKKTFKVYKSTKIEEIQAALKNMGHDKARLQMDGEWCEADKTLGDYDISVCICDCCDSDALL